MSQDSSWMPPAFSKTGYQRAKTSVTYTQQNVDRDSKWDHHLGVSIPGEDKEMLSFWEMGSVLGPAEMTELQSIFDAACELSGEPKDSERAARAAAILIRSYQRGIVDPLILVHIARTVIRAG